MQGLGWYIKELNVEAGHEKNYRSSEPVAVAPQQLEGQEEYDAAKL
jgi:hypothetical protein